MRFPAATAPNPPLRSVTELVRRAVTPKPAPAPRTETPPQRPDEMPLDLDERVRLVGEW